MTRDLRVGLSATSKRRDELESGSTGAGCGLGWRLTAGVANRHGSQVEGHDLLQASTTAIWL
jgi:pantoate kinase